MSKIKLVIKKPHTLQSPLQNLTVSFFFFLKQLFTTPRIISIITPGTWGKQFIYLSVLLHLCHILLHLQCWTQALHHGKACPLCHCCSHAYIQRILGGKSSLKKLPKIFTKYHLNIQTKCECSLPTYYSVLG